MEILREDYVDYLKKLADIINEYAEDIENFENNTQAYDCLDTYILEQDFENNLEIVD